MTAIVRVHYREQQRLRAADLTAEQAARLGALGRHHVTHHQWGIVRGLWLTEGDGGEWYLSPGIAIDGYGREIIVPDTVPIGEPDNSECWSILLYYCEAPASDGPCLGKPPSRIAGDYRIEIVSWDVSPPEEWLDLARARSAGPMTGLPPWPVPLGRVGYCGDDEESGLFLASARYARVRGDMVTGPSGRATMQLGLRDATDIHHFLLSTGADRKTLERRVGINRDGSLHVWKPLVLTGDEAVGQAAFVKGASIQLSTMMPGGIGRTILAEGTITPTTKGPALAMAWHDAALARPIAASSLLATTVNKKPAMVTLMPGLAISTMLAGETKVLKPFLTKARATTRSGVTAEQPAAAIAGADATGAPAPFMMRLTATGGHLRVGTADGEAEPEAKPGCGDISRSHSAPPPSPHGVVIIEPAVESPLAETARGIYALGSMGADLTPLTELRLVGGAFEKSDAARRLTFGRRNLGWEPVLSLDGAGRLGLQGALGVEDGMLYLPPVSAAPTDLLFQDLQLLALLGGLRRAGRVESSALTLSVTPASLADGGQLTYGVTGVPVTDVKRCFAIIRGTEGSGDVIVDSVAGALGGTINPFRHRATKIKVEVVLLLFKNNQNLASREAISADLTVSH